MKEDETASTLGVHPEAKTPDTTKLRRKKQEEAWETYQQNYID